jgi:very-short-patch-repair endonuclease
LCGRFFEIDCLWQERRLAVELDGRAVHGTPLAFESDRERDRALLAAGWSTMRVTWRQLHDEPKEIASDLSRLLSLRTVI